MWKHNYLIRVQVFLQLIEPFLTALTENIETWFGKTSSLSVFISVLSKTDFDKQCSVWASGDDETGSAVPGV